MKGQTRHTFDPVAVLRAMDKEDYGDYSLEYLLESACRRIIDLEKTNKDIVKHLRRCRRSIQIQEKTIDEMLRRPSSIEEEEDVARIYLMCGRKAWAYDLPDGWNTTHFERFDFVECGIFEKPRSELTEEDMEWVEYHSEPPEDWVPPSPVKEEKCSV